MLKEMKSHIIKEIDDFCIEKIRSCKEKKEAMELSYRKTFKWEV
jgi:hypothetical protein